MQRQFKRPASAFVTLALVLVLGISVFAQFGGSGNTGSQPQSNAVLTSQDAIRSAQVVLRDRGHYEGPINGIMTPATRNALRQFQRDRNLPETGDLDIRTARALGITSDTGSAADLIEIVDPRAERVGRDSVRIDLTARTRGTGWRISTDNFVTRDTLHVYVRGVPPRYHSGQRIDEQRITDTVNLTNNVSRVVFHGSQRDITVDLLDRNPGGGGGNTGGGAGGGIGNPRQISFLATRLLNDYARELNVRTVRGELVFGRERNLRDREVELLFLFNSLKATAELYNSLTTTVNDPEPLKGAADSLLRQARLVNRLLRRETGTSLSSVVATDWDQLKNELSRITLTDVNLDNDPDRNR